ncbi:unnamed protein product [Adineta ricciae]|uniref:Rho-GAP domain-containing protein n=1 Tax=Adineta ricciae TaxID=249248 RepID=A0A813ZB97_ADIRI|nr:unnamed protein product [Adineta ricciae]CAF1400949.1 unnamed protein product [Adineta ricciae]
MDRQVPLPRFRLDSDSSNEQNPSNQRSISHVNPRSQIRTRQSPCSDLQSTTIPEEHIYNGDHQSSVLTDQSCSKNVENSKTGLDHQRLSKGDSIKLCRQRCQSHYKSLDATQISSFASLKLTANHRKTNDGDEGEQEEGEEEEDDEIIYRPPPRTKYRYSLPDASPATLALRNILKRNKTLKSSCFGHGLPSNSSHSLSMSLSNANASSSSSSSPISTFRNFLSLVKIPSSKSNTNSTTSHHSSLTTLTNATGSSSTTLNQPILSIPSTMLWHFETDKTQWCSADSISKISLGAIELHNLTHAEYKQLKRIVLQRLQSTQYDLGVTIHVPKEEIVRKRRHHFIFRSKSNEKSKDAKDTKSNGNVFGVALSQCINDDDSHLQDEILPTPTTDACGTNRKFSADAIDISPHATKTSPTGSVSSANDSGCLISPASPSSLHISDSDYEQSKFRSVSLEVLGSNEPCSGMSRIKTLRCYPAKVPDLIKNCCDYLEKNGLQTVGLFRVGVSKKRLKELKDQINSNRSLTFDATTNAHDIAGLIKEFLRELPEPLLTRDLCAPFLNIRTKLHPKDQLRALAYLICLLPSSNRDTLYTLLKFLYHISLNSQDRCSIDGKVLVPGNKMDAANLAIVFAPTVLMDGKAPAMSNKETSMAMTADQMEQGKSILKMMIEQYKELFIIPKELHDEICLGLYEDDPNKLMRALGFKIQQGCGISSIQLDDENEQLLMSIDVTPITCEISSSNNSLFNALIPRMNQQQLHDAPPRRYNLRRNSDFPCTSNHTSRSSEYLQVPMSSSQQRLVNSNPPSLSKLPRVRDIREASMDQIIFRVIDPLFSVTPRPSEPIINVSSFEEGATVRRPTSLEVQESPITPTPSPSQQPAPLLREIRPYARSKTAPLSSVSGAQQFLTPKKCEARDLCGSSSNDESPTLSTGHDNNPI